MQKRENVALLYLFSVYVAKNVFLRTEDIKKQKRTFLLLDKLFL